MSVSLNKGDRVELSKDSRVNAVSVCLGWDTAKYDDDGDFDLDASAFVIGRNGMTRRDEDFIFYNNLQHPSGGITHSGDNLTGGGDGDDEVIKVVLDKLPKYAEKVVFCVTIHEAERRMQNFGMVENSFIRVVDDNTGCEITRYDLKEKFGDSTAIIAGEIYRDGSGWKFHAVGDGFNGGLFDLCEKFGLDANDENGARQYAMKKITVQQKIDTLKDTIEEFKKAKDQQDEIRKAVKQELDELKEEKERTVYQMEADQQIIQLHEGMNASASSSESDHMLERVREGAKKTRERAAGAQIAYDTSAKAQDRRLEAQARNREADELLAEMKRKRGNN